MLKRKEFILGAAVGLGFAAAATAGGVISWPSANAEPVRAASGQIIPSAGAAGVAFAPPPGAPLSFADIFEQVAPAVVQIDVKTRVERPRTLTLPGFPFQLIPPGSQGRGGSGDGEGEDNTQLAEGAGSGFFISADGYIVTNNHVVANAEEITVKLSDTRELKATLVGRDESTDLAVIKVEGSGFSFVNFEEAAEPRVGDWVISVGNPFGLGGTATAGIVSARARSLPNDVSSAFVDYLQIDSAINRGNSGGPTFDIYGRVIGVNTAIFSPTGGSVGIGFAIPASTAKSVTDQLMSGRAIERGYLGATVMSILPDQQQAMGLETREGAYIVDVVKGGPAERGGLKAGDIVLRLNGNKVTDSTALTRAVAQTRPGDTLRLDILRDGRAQTLNARSGTRPAESSIALGQTGEDGAEGQAPETPQSRGTEVGGLTLAPVSAALRDRYSIPADVNGVVVTAGGRGDNARIPAGVVIIRAGNRAVTSVADVQAEVTQARQAGRDLMLLFWTPQGNQPYVLKLPKSE